MKSGLRPICSLLTALAVFLVSATCSSAGCLLQLGSERPAAAHKSCCAAPQRSLTGQNRLPDGRERCPLCQNPLLIGKTVEKSRAPNLALLNFALVSHPPVALAPAHGVCAHKGFDDASFPTDASTLLALHCALLT
jgi:hypothetical protein